MSVDVKKDICIGIDVGVNVHLGVGVCVNIGLNVFGVKFGWGEVVGADVEVNGTERTWAWAWV